MTLRLVALMSVVLLLSLAAFGLAMSHYQDQVMEEVTHTASVVGQATLRTLDQHRLAPGVSGAVAPPGEAVMLWKAACESGEHEDGVRRTFSYEVKASDGAAAEPTADVATRLFISVDRVRAVSDPTEGLVLKIPTFVREAGGPSVKDPPHADADGEQIKSALEEIRLRLPVEQAYEDLFSSIRGRSLFLFLGVFVVGTALSAGLASRFTRPIRRLDAGIRRLSAGDLDVEVEAHGKDEIARLGRAFNDMTRRLRASRERARELVRKEQLSALGRLAAGVAHDVRNPLHSIGLTLDHLTETGRPESAERGVEFDRSLEIIRGEIRRLDRLVGNFIRFAGSGRGERQSVDLTELLRETVRLVSKEAERRGVEIGLALDETAPAVEADGEALRSSILNLVLNSFEAMPEGGRLSLALGVKDDEVTLEVADTGRGIPEAEQDRVFEFAYTTREDGNGMGLAMVHHCIVEEHGGRVSLDSRPGEGTRVRLVLSCGSTDRRARG